VLKLQKDVHKYLKDRNWHKLPLDHLAISLSIEAAELLEHFQWVSVENKNRKIDKQKFEAIQNEVADIFIYCCEFAAISGFDLEKAVSRKLKRVSEKYPASVFKKYLPGSKEYWKVKEEYRNKVKSEKISDIISSYAR